MRDPGPFKDAQEHSGEKRKGKSYYSHRTGFCEIGIQRLQEMAMSENEKQTSPLLATLVVLKQPALQRTLVSSAIGVTGNQFSQRYGNREMMLTLATSTKK